MTLVRTAKARSGSPLRSARLVLAAAVAFMTMSAQVSSSGSAAAAGTGLVYTVVDADNDPYSGIYLRDGTSMAQVQRVSGRYMLYGTTVELICGTWGESVGPFANRRWHQVRVNSNSGGAPINATGWIADRYLNTPNKANQLTPGEPECGAPPPPPPPLGGASVFYSGRGDAGWDLAKPFASVILTDNGTRGYKDWSKGKCSLEFADRFTAIIDGRTVTTLTGYSLGRLGPIYAIKKNPGLAASVRYILMFDPGNLAQLSGCDAKIDASVVLANWLSSNASNRLVIMAGVKTADYNNPKNGRAHAGIQNVYFPSIRDLAIESQVLVCNVENDGEPWSHRDVLKGYAWMISQPPPSVCPSGFQGWQP